METQATRATLGHKILAILMSIVLVVGLSPSYMGAQAAYADDDLQAAQISTQDDPEPTAEDYEKAEYVDTLIEKISTQQKWTSTLEAECAATKAAWDALTPLQQSLVEQADYFTEDTGDASLDDPLATAPNKANEILVVSFGTSYNGSRAATIGAVEKAIQAANPDWSVRRAFTAQIIINHVLARDNVKINNVEQALDAAVKANVKNLVVAPTHLMYGAEYDELVEALEPYQAKMNIRISEPLLGKVGATASETNADKEAVAKAVVAAACQEAGYTSATTADIDGAAIVLMGHGTPHDAKITYLQMQAQMDALGYKNVFVGTVEGNPESTSCENVIAAVKAKGYKKVFLRPLMVVAGDHANNDMADPEDEESWYSMFVASKAFDSVTCQIHGLGEIEGIQQLYVNHVAKAMPDVTELDISNLSASGMFNAISATVKTNADGSALLTFAMNGSGYLYMYKGTKEEAVANGDKPETWIPGVLNAYGKYEFQLPLKADELCKAVPVVSISDRNYKKYKSGSGTLASAFYPRQFVVNVAQGTLETNDLVEPADLDALIEEISEEQTGSADLDAKCAKAKKAWDEMIDPLREQMEQKDYFESTGDASKDDPLNANKIGDNEILVVSFGTSYTDNRVATIGAIEKAIQAAYPDWSVRRAFTAQIIISHIQTRDGEKIDNMDQALERAAANGVKNLVVAPTHLMHGAEYDEMVKALEPYQSKMNISISEPLLGEVGATASETNADKEAVAKAVVAAACKDANYADAAEAAADGAAIVLMGHGTPHDAKITYLQMQAQMDALGYKNVFVGTVEGNPESTSCENVIAAVKAKGYKKVFLRPLMVVAGDHANNDMADPEDEESWYSMFVASGAFDSVTCQIKGLGEIPAVQNLYIQHVSKAVENIKPTPTPEKKDAKVKITKKKSFKASALKTAKKSYKAVKVTTDGKVTYKVTKNANKKYIKFKAGKVTVKKNTPKGKYTVKGKVSAKEGTKYNALKATAFKTTVTVK